MTSRPLPSADELRLLIEQSPDAIVRLSHDLRYLYANPAVRQVLEVDPDAVIGRTLAEVGLPGEAVAFWQTVVDRVIAERADTSFEYQSRVAPSHWYLARVSPVADDDGSVRSVLVVARDISEGKRAELALRERERQLQSVLANSPDAVARFDRELRYLVANPVIAEALGLTVDDVIGRSLAAVMPDDGVATLRATMLRRVFASGQPLDLDWSLETPNGTRYFETRMTPELDDAGGVASVLAISRDMTERVLAERALRESEQRFERAFSQAGVGMALLTIDGHYLRVNGALAAMLGRDEAEFSGLSFRDVTHPEDVADDGGFDALLSGRVGSWEREKRYLRRDGGIVWASVSVAIVRDEAGEPRYQIVQVQDITGRKRAEAELRASEERFRTAFDSLPVGVVIGADGGALLHANPAFCRMLGYAEAELQARGIGGITHPDDREQDRERARGLVDDAAERVEYEKRYLHADGAVVWARVRLSLLGRLPDGRRSYVGHVQDITEQKRVEAALRERDRQLQGAFDDAAIGMTLVAPDGRFLRVNRAFCTMLGMTPDALLTTTFTAITHPDDLGADQALADRLLADEIGSYQLEKRYLTVAGEPLWVLLTVSLARDDAGVPLYFVAQVQDISQRKAAESALQASEARFETVFEEAAVGMALIATDGRLLRVNRALQVMLGYDAGELTRLTAFAITHPDDVAADHARAAEIAAGGARTISREKRYLTKDGRVVWGQLSSAVVVDDAGQPLYLVAQVQDISERRRAEAERERLYEETERARGQLRAVVDAVGEAIVLIGPDARILMVNDQFEGLFGVRGETLLGRSAQGIRDIAATIFGGVEHYDDTLLALVGDDARAAVLPLRQRWPVERELEVGSVPVRAGSGEFLGRLFTFRDVTREREVDRMKTEFVSLVSHELRTPLTSIAGYVDLMLEGETGSLSDEQRQFLEIVGNNASRLVALINDLLDISRIEAGKVELRRVALRLADVVEPVVASFRPQVEARGQRVTVAVPADLPLVLADEDRLAQIVTNLVSNAHKYTPAGGTIELRAEREGATVALHVVDSGIGLSAAEQEQLYTRFFRASNELTRSTAGTGLGLAITRSLVEMHGGEIRVRSAPGEGSCFTITLPVVGG